MTGLPLLPARQWAIRACALVLAGWLAACASAPPPPPQPTPAPRVEQPTYSQEGAASWYGNEQRGQKTASGEIFNPSALTAAHRSLPLDTVARVTNLDNGEMVKVRINDRGPFVAGRILDLSEAAARAIGAHDGGIIHVKIEVFSSDQGVASR